MHYIPKRITAYYGGSHQATIRNNDFPISLLPPPRHTL